NIQRAAAFDKQGQFGHGFENKETGNTHLPGIEAQVDKFGVLVTVADDQTVVIAQLGQCDDQLRLAAGLKTVVVVTSVVRDLFNNVALLVDLDGEYAAIAALIATFCNSECKGFVEDFDAMVEQVADAQYRWHVQ